MERVLCIPLGLIVERRTLESIWQHYSWRPSGVLVGTSRLRTGTLLWGSAEASYYFAGAGTLSLYPTDVPSYRENLTQIPPRLYVVLAARGYGRDDEPPGLHLLTAAPDEAQSYLDGGDPGLVDGIPMPRPLRDLIAAYVDEYDQGDADAQRTRRRPVSFNIARSNGRPA
jgi:hypothetical protein